MNSLYWSKWHWCNGIAARTVELSEQHWRDCDAKVPSPSPIRLTRIRQPTHDRYSPKGIDSTFATVQHGSNSPNCWMQFERFRLKLPAPVRWMRKCVDPISKSDRTRSYLPSKMIERADLGYALERHPKWDLQHDARKWSIYVLVRLAASPVGNVLKRDI